MLKYDPVGTFPAFIAIRTTWFAGDLGAGVSGESWIWAVEEELDSRKRRIERDGRWLKRNVEFGIKSRALTFLDAQSSKRSCSSSKSVVDHDEGMP